MKKLLVLFLIAIFVLGVTGTAFASLVDVDVDANVGIVKQKSFIENKAIAKSGDANAIGNISTTVVGSNSKAFACKGDADSKSTVVVVNSGKANAWSGDATAVNLAKNDVEQKAVLVQKNIDKKFVVKKDN